MIRLEAVDLTCTASRLDVQVHVIEQSSKKSSNLKSTS